MIILTIQDMQKSPRGDVRQRGAKEARQSVDQGCHVSACLTGLAHGTMRTEHTGQSTVVLGCACFLVWKPEAERPGVQWGEEQRHEDDKRSVLQYGGGRHRRAVGRLTSPAECPAPPAPSASATNDLGGVVTSAQGPEAGVWVIAETTDLPTKFAKIVVTDEQGRYVMPDLPKANYNVWVRGYGLVDSPKVQSAPGTILNLTGGAGAERGGSGAVLSGHLLVCHAQDPGQERVPRHRAARQRHAAEPEESGGLAGQREDPRLHVVSCAGHDWDTHDPEGTGRIQGFD